MLGPKLTPEDWIEIYHALEAKADRIEAGLYDFCPNEVDRPGSETSRWSAHLRQIMQKIGEL
jgi:hypothetical protein